MLVLERIGLADVRDEDDRDAASAHVPHKDVADVLPAIVVRDVVDRHCSGELLCSFRLDPIFFDTLQ